MNQQYTMLYTIVYKGGRVVAESRLFWASCLADAQAQAQAWVNMPASSSEVSCTLDHVGLGVL